MPQDPEELFTTPEAADWLRVRPETMRTWRYSGRGPRFVRLGDGPKAPIRYRRRDLESYLSKPLRSTVAGGQPAEEGDR